MRLQAEENAWATADSAESRAGGGVAWEILSHLPRAAPGTACRSAGGWLLLPRAAVSPALLSGSAERVLASATERIFARTACFKPFPVGSLRLVPWGHLRQIRRLCFSQGILPAAYTEESSLGL